MVLMLWLNSRRCVSRVGGGFEARLGILLLFRETAINALSFNDLFCKIIPVSGYFG